MIWNLLVLAIIAPQLLLAGRIQLVNLTPEEAQKYITQQSLDLRYAKKLGDHPLGYFRNIQDPAAGKFYQNGRLIEHPEDYVEEAYEASQFHGQDGLGRAMFGYTDYNQARLEARNTNGEVRGSYQYMDPFGQEIVVQYWSDGLGFHQIDNRPEVVLEPVTETPEVREARIAHLKAWEEAANLVRFGKPVNNINRPVQNGVEEEDEEIVGALSNQHQSLVRYPSLPYQDHISPETSPAASNDAVVVEAARNLKKRQNEESSAGSTDQEEEPHYDPKGFFYSFEYPVFNIVQTEAAKARSLSQKVKRSNPESEVNVKDETIVEAAPVEEPKVAVKTTLETVSPVEKPALEDTRISFKAVQTGEQLVAAVHDVQVSPKQKVDGEQ
ncbi:uncharacterized protein LOC131692935 [Topomyia yanbarensis]|uniref:uncharacterized protein LOC131692935 n=1 Tax=Topomyia yanbarensis TaxID=2498891 RepID=UPI00273BEA81|nr:uncharacterized protein LOC131692935 [Topomyia yanbarensis]